MGAKRRELACHQRPPRPPQTGMQIAPGPRGSQSAERVVCSSFFSVFSLFSLKLQSKSWQSWKLSGSSDSPGKNGVERRPSSGTFCRLARDWKEEPSLQNEWPLGPLGAGLGEETPAHTEEADLLPVGPGPIDPLTRRKASPHPTSSEGPVLP